jgi:catalase
MSFVYAHFATVLSPGWEDFEQARALWRILERDGEQEAFVDNVVAHLKSAVPRCSKAQLVSHLKGCCSG